MQRISAIGAVQEDRLEKLQRLKAAMPCGIIRFTCEKYPSITFMNEEMKYLLGVTTENVKRLEYMLENIFFMFPLEERERFRGYLDAVNGEESTVACNHSLSRCDGGISLVTGWLSKVTNASGIQEYQGAYIDSVSGEKEEQEIRTQELIRIISEAYDVVFTIDLTKHTIRCLQGKRYGIFKEMQGIRMIMEDAVKCWISRSILKEDQENVLKFWQKFRQSGAEDGGEEQIKFRILDRDQEERTYRATFVYVDKTRRLFCCQDITEKQEKSEVIVEERKVFIRTFGHFEIFIDNIPIHFGSEKAKELLALLVDRRGGFLTQSEAISYLWEDESFDKPVKDRYRKVAKKLMDTLKEYGAEGVVVAINGNRRIDMEKVRCDLYEYLAEDRKQESEFYRRYMENYSWGEDTLGALVNL